MTLLSVYANRMDHSISTPKVAFLSSTSGDELQKLFNNVYYMYRDVLFKYGSKPLLLTFPNNNPRCNSTIGGASVSTYFECKQSLGLTRGNASWSFLENYPPPNHFTIMPDGLKKWLSQPLSKTSGWIIKDHVEGDGTIAQVPIMGMKARISMISGPEHRV